MIHSSEFDFLDTHSRYFALAQAYIRGAILLCQTLVDGVMEPTFPNACVALWLSFHSTELFYKGSLFAAKGRVPRPRKPLRGHNIVFFEQEFREQFPQDRFPFSPPASMTLMGNGWKEEEINEFLRDANTFHEVYRYPTDIHGKVFQRSIKIDPQSFLDKIMQSESEMKNIIGQIEKNHNTKSKSTGRKIEVQLQEEIAVSDSSWLIFSWHLWCFGWLSSWCFIGFIGAQSSY